MKKAANLCDLLLFLGRDEATRTPDPYVPNVVRYQLRYIPMRVLMSQKASAKIVLFIGIKNYFKENKNLNDCVEKLKMETRRYAKRQITWFKRDSEINWIYIDEYNSFEEIYSYAKAVIERGLLYG